MTVPLNDTDVIVALKQGDARAIDRLFDQYFTALCYFSEKITHNREEARDIAIDSFSKLWLRKENFETQANVKAFLYISTKNASIDFLKKKERKNLRIAGDEFVDVALEDEAERLLTEAELLRKIYAEVQNLPDKCKEVFLLTYFDGLNTKQIAERLNISVSNVTSQRSRAVQLLKNIFTDKELLLFLLLIRNLWSGN